MKLVSCKSALNPSVVYSTDRSKAVVPVLVLLVFVLCVYSTRRFGFCLVLFCSCICQSFEHHDYLAWRKDC